MDKSTICALPWVHRYTCVPGEAQVCCNSANWIKDENGVVMTGATPDEAVMNSSALKKMRLEMTQGKWPASCENCRMIEKHGSHSMRHVANQRFSDVMDAIVKKTKKDGSIPVKVLSRDYRLGNTCNSACRMCDAWNSSLWEKDWPLVVSEGLRIGIDLNHSRKVEWYKNPEAWNGFENQVKSLRRLHFAGGEPMIVPQMIAALETCIRAGVSSQIDLSYNTNVTVIPTAVKKLWPQFKSVLLYASVDGFGPMNEYIRYPVSWKKIDANLKELEADGNKFGVTDVWICCVVQAYNVLQMEPLFDYISKFRNIFPVVGINRLIQPEHLSTQVLPRELKELAKSRLLKYLDKTQRGIKTGEYPEQMCALPEKIHYVINDMFAEDRSHLFPKFLAEAKLLDRRRKQSLFDLVPELSLGEKVSGRGSRKSPRCRAEASRPRS